MTPRRLTGAILSLLGLLPAAALTADPVADNWSLVTFEEVRFDSRGARIAGELFSPVGEPIGGLVLTHGAGETLRLDAMARLFATEGFAVLTYDKRGAGESGGALPDAGDAAAEHFAVLAEDASAGLEWLAARESLAGLPVGYWGVDTAAWTAPLAASQAPQADFIVLWNGAAMTLSAWLEDEIANGDHAGAEDDMRARVAALRAGGMDVDPGPAIAGFNKPSLWVYGARDGTMPVQDAMDNLRMLIGAGNTGITVYLNEDGGHTLDLARDRAVFDGIVGWMRSQADTPVASPFQPVP